MKQWTLSIILAAATAVVVSAQTTSTYRGMTVRVPDPTGAAGLAWQNNFKSLADRIGNHIEAVSDPTANDDEANTAGHGAVMDRSTWRNTEDNGFFVCVDASEGAAVWIELGEAVDLSAPGPIGDATPSSAEFTTLTTSGDVGVGTGSPQTRLHVYSSADTYMRLESGKNQNSGFVLGEDVDGVPYGFNIFYDGSATNRLLIQAKVNTSLLDHVSIGRDTGDMALLRGTLSLPNDNQHLILGLGDDFDISYDDSKGVIDCAGGVYVAEGPLDVAGVIAWRNTSGNYIGFFTQASSGGRVLLSNSAGATAIDLKAAGPSYMHTSLGINESAPDYALDVNGSFGCTPGSSVTPADNGDLVIEATSNTSLTFRYKGSDGTVRSASLTLSP